MYIAILILCGIMNLLQNGYKKLINSPPIDIRRYVFMERKDPLFQGSNISLEKISGFLKKFKFDIKDIKDIDLDNTYIKNIKLKRALALFMIATMMILGYTGYKVNEIKTRAYDVYFGEEKIGTLKTEEEALQKIKEVKAELSSEYGASVVLNKEIKFERTHVKDSEISSDVGFRESVKSNIGALVSGYSLKVNGEELGVLKSKKEVDYVINKIKEPYLKRASKDATIKEVKILEDIEIAKKEVPIGDIDKQNDLIEYIKTGSEEVKIHVVEVGESFWTIAKIYGMKVEDLEQANSDRDPTKLKPGDEIKLLVPKSKITVATKEEVEYTEEVNYDVKIEEDKNMYKNQKKVKVQGVNGENKIVASEVRHNGVSIEKEILKEEVIREPVTEVVVQGTKEVPKTVATGTFFMPTRGRITSPFGRRWGRMHTGIDIGASHGSAIKAADGGTVSFSGYQGSYGYMVEINHGNGYRTRYAHCSKIHVKKGQKVAKGQHIANVGNTGRSYGSHVHFEVIKNGVHQNPTRYVR